MKNYFFKYRFCLLLLVLVCKSSETIAQTKSLDKANEIIKKELNSEDNKDTSKRAEKVNNIQEIEKLIPIKNYTNYGLSGGFSLLNLDNVLLPTSCDILTNDDIKPLLVGLNKSAFFGMFVEIDNLFTDKIGLQLKLVSKYRNGILSGEITKFKIPFVQNDSIILARISEESHYSLLSGQFSILATLSLSDYYRNNFLENFKLKLGVELETMLWYSQADSQRAISPDNLLFPNERRIQEYAANRLYYNATIPINLCFGFDYKLSDRVLLDINYSKQLLGYNTNNTWLTDNLWLGGSYNFAAKKFDTLFKPPVKIDTVVPKIPNLVAFISTIPDTVSVRIEEYDSVETLPLLNQIFFKQNTSEIGEKYILYSKDSVKFFTTKITGSALDVYYNYLNIIAFRMKNIPTASIEINGYCNGVEKDKKLSLARANFLKDYLVNNWGISPNRIKTSSGLLPPSPSSEQIEEGKEENARAEIESDDPRITIPFIRRYIHQKANPPSVVFKPFVETEAGLKDWKIVIMEDTVLWKVIKTKDSIPQKIEWNWRNDENKYPTFPLSFFYYLWLTDNSGRTVSSKVSGIKVNYDSLQFKLQNNRNDTLIENYSLLLFNYDSPKISESDKLLLTAIANRIGVKASVSITGYTDSLGTEEHNRTLAIARAKETANFLKTLVPKSVTIRINEISCGEFERFSYTTPEGRSHCRTVIIDVRTPVVRNKK